MANLNNFGQISGRLAHDPRTFQNQDGSRVLKISIYADRNYRNKSTGKRDSDLVQLEAFVPAGGQLGPFQHLYRGSEVAFGYTIRSRQFVDQHGERQYVQVLRIEDVDLRESLSRAATRLAERAAAAEKVTAQQEHLRLVG